jgi:hypothetical protein
VYSRVKQTVVAKAVCTRHYLDGANNKASVRTLLHRHDGVNISGAAVRSSVAGRTQDETHAHTVLVRTYVDHTDAGSGVR